jgi:hypothetical protein
VTELTDAQGLNGLEARPDDVRIARLERSAQRLAELTPAERAALAEELGAAVQASEAELRGRLHTPRELPVADNV